jgi:uncharacterized protein (TIGR04255 family)
MPFPKVQRVIYKNNPLDQVICQLRFPPILRIDAQLPAGFQERIRADYPNLAESQGIRFQPPDSLKAQIPGEILGLMMSAPETKNYEFSSEDGRWRINLTRAFLALTTTTYRKWETFQAKLAMCLQALIDEYSPAFFSRIGLRYTNVIRRSILGLDGVDWTELLKPHVLGVLASPEVGKYVRNFETQHEIHLGDGASVVRMTTKLAKPVDDDETCYVIDSDFYCEARTAVDATMQRLDYLHARASRLIQWCITERLHQAMEPERL